MVYRAEKIIRLALLTSLAYTGQHVWLCQKSTLRLPALLGGACIASLGYQHCDKQIVCRAKPEFV